MDSRIIGAKHSVQTMMYYYLSALIGSVEDPKQYIATELGKMIDLSEEQIQYVKLNVANDNKMLDNLSSSIALLESMEKAEKLDLESVRIVKQILEIMKEQCEQTLKEYTEMVGDIDGDNDDDEQQLQNLSK